MGSPVCSVITGVEVIIYEPRTRLRRIARTLRGHQICREDRTVDPEAMQVVQHLAAEQLRGGKRRKSS